MWRKLWRTASAVPWNQLPPSSVCSAARTLTKPDEKMSNLYVRLRWRLRLSELNWVNTNMRRKFEFRQLLIGMSINRYLPPIGTAGFDRRSVSGKSRVPRPPPRMIASTSSMGRSLSHGSARVEKLYQVIVSQVAGKPTGAPSTVVPARYSPSATLRPSGPHCVHRPTLRPFAYRPCSQRAPLG